MQGLSNRKRLIGSMVVGVVLSLGAIYFYRGQETRQLQGLANEAYRAEQDGDAALALKFLDKYLETRPNDPMVTGWYALILSNQARSAEEQKQVVDACERALHLDPGRTDIRRCLVHAAMSLGDYTRARRNIDPLLREQPRDGELKRVLARCYETEHHYEKAAELLAQAVQEEPGRVETYERLARAWRRSNQGQRADQAMNELVRVHASDYQAWLARSEYRREFGLQDDVLADLAEAVKLAPDRPEVLLARGTALLNANRFEEAVGEFKRLGESKDPPPAARLGLARALLLRNLRLPEARRDWPSFEVALGKLTQGNPDTEILRTEMLAARNLLDAAQKVIDDACRQQPRNATLQTARAQIMQRRGKNDEALRAFQETRKELGDQPELARAEISYWSRRGGDEARQALTALEKRAEDYPVADRVRVLEALASARYKLGASAAAQALWNQVARLQPNDLNVRLLLFDLALQGGDQSSAEQRLQAIQRIEGNDGPGARSCGVALLLLRAQLGDKHALAEARSQWKELAALRPAWSRVALLEAGLDEAEGQIEPALEHYRQAVERGERRPQVIRRAVQLLNGQRRFQEAEQFLLKVHEEVLESPDLGRLAVAVSLGLHDSENALALARQTVAADSRDFRDQLWLGQVFWAADRRAEAEKAFRQATELARQQSEPWVELVQFLTRTGQAEKATAAVAAAEANLKKESAQVALATCFELVGQLKKAEPTFRAALAAHPDDPAMLRAVAEFYLHQGVTQPAEVLLRKILTLRSGVGQADMLWARRVLALASVVNGSYERLHESLKMLDANLLAQPGSPEDLRAKATLLATHIAHQAEAITVLEELRGRNALAAEDQFLLARLYDERHDWKQARQCLDRLVALDDKNPQYLGYALRAAIRHGDLHGIPEGLARLQKLEPDSLLTRELQARLLMVQGKKDDAVAILLGEAHKPQAPLDVLAAILEDLGQKAPAEELYRRLAASSKKPGARLALAGFLARSDRGSEALALCERAWALYSPEVVAQIVLNILPSISLSIDQDDQLVRRLTGEVQQNPGSVTLALCLAELHEHQGRYDDAVSAYRRALNLDRNNIPVLNNLAWLLANKDEAAAAESLQWMRTAIQRAGPVPALLDTRAMANLRLHDSQSAVKGLEQAVAIEPAASRYFHLALAYREAKQATAATAALAKAQALGLQANALFPPERPRYIELAAQLGSKSTTGPEKKEENLIP